MTPRTVSLFAAFFGILSADGRNFGAVRDGCHEPVTLVLDAAAGLPQYRAVHLG
jgi:hypothetical protein